ncbi:hypothetical protein AOB57_006870 [Methanosarcina flavescens]|uniref:Uncharacterized protein n=1 Tax=Methanosarcina flavescens TaxID=1715806 RepID=A0A660HSA8_9EURY|nr:hypothetical protein AOB57_006870 [Methanosarcina flavescens]
MKTSAWKIFVIFEYSKLKIISIPHSFLYFVRPTLHPGYAIGFITHLPCRTHFFTAYLEAVEEFEAFCLEELCNL